MRDLMVFGMSTILLFMSIRNGRVAYLLWGWAGLISIQSYLYGFMRNLPYVQIFAIIALVKYLAQKETERQDIRINSTNVLFVMFVFQMVLSALFAIDVHPRSWEFVTNMLKTVLFCLLMPALVTSRMHIHAMALIIAMATAFHGLLDGLKFIASGGKHFAMGIQKFGDNNHFALVIIMAIPLLVYLYNYTSNRLVKTGFLATIPIVIFAVIATQSRGGLVTLFAVGIWLLAKSKKKFVGILGVLFCVILIVQFAPEQWVNRMNTINKAGEDSSFLERVGAWQISSAVAIQHPILGGGPHSIELGSVWATYRNSTGLLGFVSNMDLEGIGAGRGRAAHSIYFEVLGDLGFLGFFIFLAILVNAFMTAHKIGVMVKSSNKELEWARQLAQMLSASALAYVVGGALLSAAYFELPYMIFMLLEVVKQHVARETGFDKPKGQRL